MKVVLREDVESLGKKGDLLEVADGYARNYLVPRGLAMKATKGVVAQAESMPAACCSDCSTACSVALSCPISHSRNAASMAAG